jgi:AraC-like DNA-binding protein
MAATLLPESTDIAVDYANLVTRLIRLMRSSDVPMTLDDLAETAGLSPFHFARIFRSVAGVPPVEFQTALRFERARSLLLTSPASVTEICYEVGYGSLGTFSRRFKELVGVTPATFRNLPHIAADLDMRDDVSRAFHHARRTTAQVTGSVVIEPAQPGCIYVGLFAESVAARGPVIGHFLPQAGPFVLPDIPLGRFRVLAVAVRCASNPISHLLLEDDVLFGIGDRVDVCVGNEHVHQTLKMRPPLPTDTPLLTALPALLM